MTKNEIFDLYDLLLVQLRDLYNGEQQQLEIFPKLDEMTNSYELSEVIEYHRQETKQKIERMRKIFSQLDEEPEGEQCEGIKASDLGLTKIAENRINPDAKWSKIVEKAEKEKQKT